MKKLFTLWLALLFGLVANAQTKFVKSVPTLTELRALNVADIHTNVLVNSYWTSNTNSVGALFQWVPGATDATNTTSVFAPASGTGRWIRVELPANPGSATQPGFRFLGDDNTGIYNSGADAIDFSTGGSRRWGITSSGVLQAQGGQSISTTASSLTLSPSGNVVMSPGGSSKWTFNSSGNLVGTASYGGIYGGSGVPLSLNSGSGTDAVTLTINGTEGARLATTGYLGVGTTGPDRRIDSLDANNLQYRATFTDGSVYSDWGTLSTGATLWTNSLGHRMTSTTVNDTSVLARQVQGGLAFDGPSSTVADAHTIATAMGQSDLTIALRMGVQSTSPSTFTYFANLVTSSTERISLSYDANNLYVTTGASGATTTTTLLSGFWATYAGKVVDIVLVRSGASGTTALITAYVQGIQAYSNTPSNSGTTYSANALFYVGGYGSSAQLQNAGPIFSATLFNRALSASEVITLANQGVSEADKWGSLTAIVGPSTLNGGFETAGGGGADVFANWSEAITGATVLTQESDARPGSTGTKSMKIVRTNSADSTTVQQSVSLVAGKRYRVTFWGKTASSGRVNIVTTYSSTMDQVLTTSWAQYQGAVFTATATTTANFQIYMTSGTTGDYYIDDIEFNQVGSILDANLSAGVGYQVPDRSSNKYHGVVSATGTSWTQANRRGQIRYTTTGATTGAFQLLSGTAIPSNALIQSIVAWSAGTPLIYVGNATGTSNIVGHTTLVGSTYTPLTLSSQFSTTGNLWLNKSATNEVNLTVNYMIADP